MDIAFSIGDKVEVIASEPPYFGEIGEKGTVVDIKESSETMIDLKSKVKSFKTIFIVQVKMDSTGEFKKFSAKQLKKVE